MGCRTGCKQSYDSRKCGAGDLASKEVLCGDHRSVAEEKIDFKSRRLNAVVWFPQARSIY